MKREPCRWVGVRCGERNGRHLLLPRHDDCERRGVRRVDDWGGETIWSVGLSCQWCCCWRHDRMGMFARKGRRIASQAHLSKCREATSDEYGKHTGSHGDRLGSLWNGKRTLPAVRCVRATSGRSAAAASTWSSGRASTVCGRSRSARGSGPARAERSRRRRRWAIRIVSRRSRASRCASNWHRNRSSDVWHSAGSVVLDQDDVRVSGNIGLLHRLDADRVVTWSGPCFRNDGFVTATVGALHGDAEALASIAVALLRCAGDSGDMESEGGACICH